MAWKRHPGRITRERGQCAKCLVEITVPVGHGAEPFCDRCGFFRDLPAITRALDEIGLVGEIADSSLAQLVVDLPDGRTEPIRSVQDVHDMATELRSEGWIK